MVYCGHISRGCESCRRRKIKCDERKPSCRRCEVSRKQCPGYRNLGDILFRNESDRVRRRATQTYVTPLSLSQDAHSTLCDGPEKPNGAYAIQGLCVARGLSQPMSQLAANFFFTRYNFNEPPFSYNQYEWLARSYHDERGSHVLQAAIQAVGLASLSNIFNAPDAASKSKEWYCVALAALKRDLTSPVQAVADVTLMAVILLGLFETVNFRAWNRYRYWEAHVKGATALLDLRGTEQYNRERGVQLYIQVRSQILSTCMQRNLPVPSILIQSRHHFTPSSVREKWRHRKLVSPNSICEISFRIVNLRAAINNGAISSAGLIETRALAIKEDLQTWREEMPPDWAYNTIDAPESFGGKRYAYPTLWIAGVWNSWRILEILVNQILVENDFRSGADILLPSAQIASCVSVIQKASIDLCISSSDLVGSPRTTYLTEPLYLIANEALNSTEVRCFAIQQLRRLDTTMGIRYAGLLADSAAATIAGSGIDCDLSSLAPVLEDRSTMPYKIPVLSIL